MIKGEQDINPDGNPEDTAYIYLNYAKILIKFNLIVVPV